MQCFALFSRRKICYALCMRHTFSCILPVLAVLTVVLLSGAPAAAAEPPSSSLTSRLLFNGDLIATEISKVTGCAISPILGISVLGAYTYYTTPEPQRPQLPWHAAPQFWGPLLAVLLGIILKDSAKVALPKIILVPLDAAETLLEKNTSAVLALIVLLTSITGKGLDQLQLTASLLVPSFPASAHAAADMTRQAGPDLIGTLELGSLILVVLVVYTVVWIVSHSINILILVSPFSMLDLLLTLGKNSVIALLLGASLLHPLAGLLVSLAIFLLSLLLFSWSLRFVLFGTLMALDLLRGPPAALPSDTRSAQVFACRGLRGVPVMSYGRLYRTGDALIFTYRPWLFLRSRSVTLPEPCEVYSFGKGRYSGILIRAEGESGRYATLCRFRPRYNSHEDKMAEMLGLACVRDLSLARTLRDGLGWVREQFAR